MLNNRKNIRINWIYDAEDDMTEEYGEDFKDNVDYVIFNLVEK